MAEKEPKKARKEKEEGEEKEERKTPEEKVGSLTTPEAFVIFPLAALLDLAGLIILCCGLDDFWILDTIGLILIGGWMFVRIGHITATKRAAQMAEKTGKKLLKRTGLAFLIEIIPWVGGLAPSWVLAVYFELKNN